MIEPPKACLQAFVVQQRAQAIRRVSIRAPRWLMRNLRPLRSEKDYDQALAEVEGQADNRPITSIAVVPPRARYRAS